MELRTILLAQLEREIAAARKTIERTPEGRNDWRPHERSMPLGYLAALVAGMPGWTEFMIDRDQLNLDEPSAEAFKTRAVDTKAELLRSLEEGATKARAALQDATDGHLIKPWRFVAMGGRVVNEEPRFVMLMNGLFSHLAHHRGQMTVYLRLNGASVPALYGPSADEQR